MTDLTIVYYTSNFLDEYNPYFLHNVERQLVKSADGLPIVIVSQKPTIFGPNSTNVVVGEIGRSHLNIYYQILEGCKAASTKYVVMAEDDILYSHDHFHSDEIEKEFERHGGRPIFLYDMNKVSLFTWTNPPIFSFRSKRRVVNQLIADRQYLIDALEERFKRIEELKAQGQKEEQIIKFWGDPGRYEGNLGVTERESAEFYSSQPSVVFSHEHAYGYLSQGSRKRHGDIKIVELCDWGRAEEVLRLYSGKN